MVARKVTVELTVPQLDMLFRAGSYYEDARNDDPQSFATTGPQMRALDNAMFKLVEAKNNWPEHRPWVED